MPIEAIDDAEHARRMEAAERLATGGYVSKAEAARELGIHVNTFKSWLENQARKGKAPGHTNAGTAPGFSLKYLKVHRDADGLVKQTWECQTPDAEAAQEAFEAAIRDLCTTVPRAPLIPAPQTYDADLLNVIPMGDPHFGLLSWKPETGESFDLEIAEAMTFGAVDKLRRLCILQTQARKAQKAINVNALQVSR